MLLRSNAHLGTPITATRKLTTTRLRSDTHRGFNGYLIEMGRHRVVLGGDTAYTDAFRIHSRWIWRSCVPSLDPFALQPQAGADCGAEYLLPVHHQTFRLSREPFFEPVERFMDAAGSRPERVVTTRIGQEWSQN